MEKLLGTYDNSFEPSLSGRLPVEHVLCCMSPVLSCSLALYYKC